MKNTQIEVKGIDIRYKKIDKKDYISLTDIAKFKNSTDPRFTVYSWLRNKDTLRFLCVWEELNNPNFNRVEFDTVTKDAGTNAFMITPSQWIDKLNGIGLTVSAGRYNSGVFAHQDIAFEFASWISAEFKLYMIKEFQRLKNEEQKQLGWSAKRELAKINYKIHTDAIKEHLITPELSPQEMTCTYATEADILNVALFGKTAAQWRNENNIKEKSVNIRDFASAEELVVLINLEDTNADLIKQGFSQIERLKILREKAYRQLEILKNNANTIETLKQNLIENKNQ